MQLCCCRHRQVLCNALGPTPFEFQQEWKRQLDPLIGVHSLVALILDYLKFSVSQKFMFNDRMNFCGEKKFHANGTLSLHGRDETSLFIRPNVTTLIRYGVCHEPRKGRVQWCTTEEGEVFVRTPTGIINGRRIPMYREFWDFGSCFSKGIITPGAKMECRSDGYSVTIARYDPEPRIVVHESTPPLHPCIYETAMDWDENKSEGVVVTMDFTGNMCHAFFSLSDSSQQLIWHQTVRNACPHHHCGRHFSNRNEPSFIVSHTTRQVLWWYGIWSWGIPSKLTDHVAVFSLDEPMTINSPCPDHSRRTRSKSFWWKVLCFGLVLLGFVLWLSRRIMYS